MSIFPPRFKRHFFTYLLPPGSIAPSKTPISWAVWYSELSPIKYLCLKNFPVLILSLLLSLGVVSEKNKKQLRDISLEYRHWCIFTKTAPWWGGVFRGLFIYSSIVNTIICKPFWDENSPFLLAEQSYNCVSNSWNQKYWFSVVRCLFLAPKEFTNNHGRKIDDTSVLAL